MNISSPSQRHQRHSYVAWENKNRVDLRGSFVPAADTGTTPGTLVGYVAGGTVYRWDEKWMQVLEEVCWRGLRIHAVVGYVWGLWYLKLEDLLIDFVGVSLGVPRPWYYTNKQSSQVPYKVMPMPLVTCVLLPQTLTINKLDLLLRAPLSLHLMTARLVGTRAALWLHGWWSQNSVDWLGYFHLISIVGALVWNFLGTLIFSVFLRG